MQLRTAALAEPTAVAVHDVRRAQLAVGERAVVVGGGPIGLLVAAVAREAGADVVLVEPDPGRRQLAERAGLTPSTRPSGRWPSTSRSGRGSGRRGRLRGLGAVPGIQSAIDALGVRGRLVVVAIYPTPPPVDLFRVFWRD